MTVFRPCIDLHQGQVKQIVGGTLDAQDQQLVTNFVSRQVNDHDSNRSQPPSYYAQLYKTHGLQGGHIIKLGPNNDEAAQQALQVWPHAFQLGGGIQLDNALYWLDDMAAGKVIVTSWLFPEGRFSQERLRKLSELVGRERLVVDLSCRKKDNGWTVAMNKWQTLTDMPVTQEWISLLSQDCSEFLVHAADVEGLCQGIDTELVECLGKWCKLPCTYAGGAKDVSDLDVVHRLSQGRVDLTFGSALDIFGGKHVLFQDVIQWKPATGDS